MALAENLGPNLNDLPGNAFNGVLTAIDTREYVFDLETRGPVGSTGAASSTPSSDEGVQRTPVSCPPDCFILPYKRL